MSPTPATTPNRVTLEGRSSLEVHTTALRLFTNYARTMSSLYGLHVGQPLGLEVEEVGRENVWSVTRSGRGAVSCCRSRVDCSP